MSRKYFVAIASVISRLPGDQRRPTPHPGRVDGGHLPDHQQQLRPGEVPDRLREGGGVSKSEIREALRRAVAHCNEWPATDMLSARTAFGKLGFDRAEVEVLLRACHMGGFSHCLDPEFAGSDGERPPQFACIWTAEQLGSRLDSVWLRP